MVHLRPKGVPFADMVLIQYVVPLEMFKQKVIHVAVSQRGLRGRLAALFGLRVEGTMVSI